jgi:hypothetical protein
MDCSRCACSPWTRIPFSLAFIVLGFIAGCTKGGGGGSTPSVPSFTIGGAATGLSGTGLVLQDNGGNNLPVNATGSFTFTAAIANGGSYNVTILNQPSSPAQTCTVTNAGGTPSANVTSVQVACITNFFIGGTAAGISGAGLVLQNNGANNLPVSAGGSFTFTTPIVVGTSYNVTVFAQPASAATCGVSNGSGTPSANVTSVLVGCITSTFPGQYEWTWEGGSNLANQLATYGTLGVAAAGNNPGARVPAAFSTDASGNFWLFGGTGPVPPTVPPNSNGYFFNDLWKYSAGQWTWEGGSQLPNQSGQYGTQGTPSPNNHPGGRGSASSWTDAAGNFWLFGGIGYDGSGVFYSNFSYLNDLWRYSAGQWTWMSGSDSSQGALGHGGAATYGTKGVPAPGNTPGGRINALSWADKSGNLWLYGGFGYGNGEGSFSDLWKFSAGEWTWVDGPNTPEQAVVYGTQGVPAPANTPGTQVGASTWTDIPGNLWLLDADGALWEYSAGNWTWISGSPTGEKAVYGTQGVPAAGNTPGSRAYAFSWTDAAGDFWLFGGEGSGGSLSDIWRYSAGQWTWMGGPDVANQAGKYGTEGAPAPGNIPGARGSGAAWIDRSGNFWMFGGGGFDSAGTDGSLNDIWEYQP